MSNAIVILALRITCNNNFQTMSHSHDILTDKNFKFSDNLVNYTTLELKYMFKTKIAHAVLNDFPNKPSQCKKFQYI